MTKRRFRTGGLVALTLLSIYGWNSAGIAQTQGESEKFDASYVDVNTGRTGHIQISVTRWSTPAERTALQQTLFDKGQNALLDLLRDMPSVGRMSAPGNIGYDLRFATQRTLPDGAREIILATDRPMSYWEIINQPISAQYPFTWVQFRMRPDGKGNGKVAVAARIIGEKADQLIEVEDFAISPVRLENITSEKGDN